MTQQLKKQAQLLGILLRIAGNGGSPGQLTRFDYNHY